MVCFSWVFFRAEDFTQALQIIKNMFSFDISEMPNIQNQIWMILFIIYLYELLIVINKKPLVWKKSVKLQKKLEAGTLVLMILIIIYFKGEGSEFIYFQF